MGKDKKKAKKRSSSKEPKLIEKKKKKKEHKQKKKSKSETVAVEIDHDASEPINDNTTTSSTTAIPIKLSAGIDPTPQTSGWSWGAAFAAADTIRPDEADLDDGFLSRAAEADAAAASGWGKEGISSVSQLASSHVSNQETNNDTAGKQSGRKRKASDSSGSESNDDDSDNEDIDSNASVNSGESVLEGRTAVLPGDDASNMTIVLVDTKSKSVYSSGERNEDGKRLRIGKLVKGSIEFDEKAVEEMKRVESGDTGPSFPYKTDEDDHCETPLQAYADIQSILDALCKSMGKSKSSLKIYDPYFCNGSVIQHLKSLGYTNVYNMKEDCYATWEAQQEPDYDVFITNPPYSADHIDKLMSHITSAKFGTKPWLLLMPNWVHKKDYYEHATTKHQVNPIYPFYIVPKKRYVYLPPPDFREKKASDVHKKSSPFVSMWYVWGGTPQRNDVLMQAFQRSAAMSDCDVARSKSALRDLRRNGGGGSSKKSKKRKMK